jgi:hypothetical protein
MYIEFTQKQICDRIHCIPFEYISNQKEECESIFGRKFSNSDFVVYSSTHNTIVLLGYLVIDNQPIAESRHYDTFVQNCVDFSEINPTDTLLQIGCKHIAEWVLDEALKSNALLTSLFTSIISAIMPENGTIELWYDGSQELRFYPIKNDCNIIYPSAISYFVSSFMNE